MKLKSVDRKVKSNPRDDCFEYTKNHPFEETIILNVLNNVYVQTYSQIISRIRRDLNAHLWRSFNE